MKPGQLCEFAGCLNPAVHQAKIGHPLEGRWCCQECLDNPLGVQEDTEVKRLGRKIEEKQKFLREMRHEIQSQIVEHQNEILQAIFDGLKTYKTHPKILLDREMRNGKNDLEEYLTKKRLKVEDPSYLALGSWTCLASPTGSCVYDHINDPVKDCCIFCGGPEERK
jgi:hypothetical protein